MKRSFKILLALGVAICVGGFYRLEKHLTVVPVPVERLPSDIRAAFVREEPDAAIDKVWNLFTFVKSVEYSSASRDGSFGPFKRTGSAPVLDGYRVQYRRLDGSLLEVDFDTSGVRIDDPVCWKEWRGIPSPGDSGTRITWKIYGARGRSFKDRTKKTVEVCIQRGYQQERQILFFRTYNFVGAFAAASAEWPSSKEVIFRLRDDKSTILTLAFIVDEAGKFTEKR